MRPLHELSQTEREIFFREASAELGIQLAIIEKDFWVVWTLERLFSLPDLKSHLTFKGGTSLSKVFGVIERFSEDIDVSIEKEFLGFDESKDPLKLTSKNKQKTLLEDLSTTCSKYIQEKLLSDLFESIEENLKTKNGWNLEIDSSDSQTILFSYPTSQPRDGYIRPVVKIEMGARAEHWPVSEHKIQSYAKTTLKEKMNEAEVLVRVLDAERTFWEKATILHQYAHLPTEKALPVRLSRHWYDFFKLLNSPIKKKSLDNIKLLERVANHKKVYFASGWANYNSAKKGTLKLAPLDRVLADLKKDYELMNPMFFGEVPDWGKMMKAIEEFEREFNKKSGEF